MKLAKNSAQEFTVVLCLCLGIGLAFSIIFTRNVDRDHEWVAKGLADSHELIKEKSNKSATKSLEQNSLGMEAQQPIPDLPAATNPINLPNPKLEYDYEEIVQQIDSGDWRSAEKKLLAILEQDPNIESALIELAMIQILDKKDQVGAQPYLERAAKINPGNESVINELLALYEQTNQIEKGLAYFQSIASNDTKGTGVVDYGIANSLQSLGKSEEAVDYYLKAIDGDGVDRKKIEHELVDSLMDAGRPSEAISLLENVNQSDMSFEEKREIQVKLAAAYLTQGDREDAIHILQEWIKTYPRDDFAVNILSDIKNL